MEMFKLEQPIISDEDKLSLHRRLAESEGGAEIAAFIKAVDEPDYRYWDRVQFKQPLPSGLTNVQAWLAVKEYRAYAAQPTPIRSPGGHSFRWINLDQFQRLCHEFDMSTGGQLMASVKDISHAEKKSLIANGLMEEAIASAQLEGADTGRTYAKKMLREGIDPRNESDQMILNSHQVLKSVENEYKGLPMSRGLLTEMHARLTHKTLDSWGRTPKWRDTDEPLYVRDEFIAYHRAPSVSFTQTEIDRFIAFANEEAVPFLHPIIKAVMLHYWIGYLHPFTDGNGRLARTVAHWFLLRHNYWAFAYLPLAAKMKSGGKKSYTMAYVYAEQDNHDLTYFISYLLRKIEESIDGLNDYLMKERRELTEALPILRRQAGLNVRQARLAKYLSASPSHETTIASYMEIQGISRAPAIADLTDMHEKKLLDRRKDGRVVHYTASDKLKTWLEKINDVRP